MYTGLFLLHLPLCFPTLFFVFHFSSYVYVCCMCICAGALVHAEAWDYHQDIFLTCLSALFCRAQRLSLGLELAIFARLGPRIHLSLLPNLQPQLWGCSCFHLGAGNPNLGPDTSMKVFYSCIDLFSLSCSFYVEASFSVWQNRTTIIQINKYWNQKGVVIYPELSLCWEMDMDQMVRVLSMSTV